MTILDLRHFYRWQDITYIIRKQAYDTIPRRTRIPNHQDEELNCYENVLGMTSREGGFKSGPSRAIQFLEKSPKTRKFLSSFQDSMQMFSNADTYCLHSNT